MTSIPIQQAQAHLLDLIHQLAPGDEVVITENDQPVARIVPTRSMPSHLGESSRKLGGLSGTVLYMAPDFDAPLEQFKEYME
jgi:antitoxin (DNA-binding transcriptional repressor) of toxin-antitoxin stability system